MSRKALRSILEDAQDIMYEGFLVDLLRDSEDFPGDLTFFVQLERCIRKRCRDIGGEEWTPKMKMTLVLQQIRDNIDRKLVELNHTLQVQREDPYLKQHILQNIVNEFSSTPYEGHPSPPIEAAQAAGRHFNPEKYDCSRYPEPVKMEDDLLKMNREYTCKYTSYRVPDPCDSINFTKIMGNNRSQPDFDTKKSKQIRSHKKLVTPERLHSVIIGDREVIDLTNDEDDIEIEKNVEDASLPREKYVKNVEVIDLTNDEDDIDKDVKSVKNGRMISAADIETEKKSQNESGKNSKVISDARKYGTYDGRTNLNDDRKYGSSISLPREKSVKNGSQTGTDFPPLREDFYKISCIGINEFYKKSFTKDMKNGPVKMTSEPEQIAVVKGKVGEDTIREMLLNRFIDCEVNDVSGKAASGDILFVWAGLKILIEVKNKKTLLTADIEKFTRDVAENKVHAGLFISLLSDKFPHKKNKFVKTNLFIEKVDQVNVLYCHLTTENELVYAMELLRVMNSVTPAGKAVSNSVSSTLPTEKVVDWYNKMITQRTKDLNLLKKQRAELEAVLTE
jgi:hypothetical protein